MNINHHIYGNLRREMRKNIFINSNMAYNKRHLLNGEIVLMGGIVIKFEKTVGLKKESEIISIVKFISLEKYEQARQNWLTEDADGFEYKECAVGMDLELFDFSGKFRVIFESNNDTKKAKEISSKLLSIKTGDIIYVLGKLQTDDIKEGYFITAEALLNEDELWLYKMMEQDQLSQYKQRIESIKSGEDKEPISDILQLNITADQIKILRLFLKKDIRVKSDDYIFLCFAVENYCRKYHSLKFAQLLIKYYCRYSNITISELKTNEEEYRILFSIFPILEDFNIYGKLLIS